MLKYKKDPGYKLQSRQLRLAERKQNLDFVSGILSKSFDVGAALLSNPLVTMLGVCVAAQWLQNVAIEDPMTVNWDSKALKYVPIKTRLLPTSWANAIQVTAVSVETLKSIAPSIQSISSEFLKYAQAIAQNQALATGAAAGAGAGVVGFPGTMLTYPFTQSQGQGLTEEQFRQLLAATALGGGGQRPLAAPAPAPTQEPGLWTNLLPLGFLPGARDFYQDLWDRFQESRKSEVQRKYASGPYWSGEPSPLRLGGPREAYRDYFEKVKSGEAQLDPNLAAAYNAWAGVGEGGKP